ncbi:MAG TPA: hypothetical protein VM366_01645 [Anaerolineae bacterium]|nr:hypothetical protein [Anaerolineae bacterium]
MVTCSLYGFSPDLPPFAGKSPAEQVAILRSWGNTAIFGGYKDLAFLEAAHEAGMAVYAEFGCFLGQEWWEALPESRPVTAEGRPLEPEGWYYGVNPSLPAVRQARLEALEALLAAYPIDGVWLDFIRWPCHWEVHEPYLPRTSFDAGTVARFCRDTGIEVQAREPRAAAETIRGQHAKAWRTWRCEQITSWVAEARAVVERVRPGAILGLFGVPWRLADYDGAILDVIGQDYRALGAEIDVFSPMVYHRMCGHGPAWVGAVTAHVHEQSHKAVWPIVQSVDQPDALSAEEYATVLDVALNHPAADGVLVFALQGALEPAKLEVTIARFQDA